jgi:gliding motility-associated-like protein
MRIVQDLNNNGSFIDEPESSYIDNAYFLGGTSYVFKNVLLQDGIRFTLARTNTFEDESKLSLTPNGDGINDSYPINSAKPIKIFDSSGNLIRRLQGPCTWDGTNQEGIVVNTGYYIIQIGEDSFTGITVIH